MVVQDIIFIFKPSDITYNRISLSVFEEIWFDSIVMAPEVIKADYESTYA